MVDEVTVFSYFRSRSLLSTILPLNIVDGKDVDLIKSEVKAGNVVITNVSPLAKHNIEDVKRAINELNEYAALVQGDIARLGEERVILTPRAIKIWRA